MRVAALYIYPIKACRGVAIDAARVTARGFAHDRRFLVTNGAGQFLTQRSHPLLGRLDVSVGPASITIATPGREPLTVAVPTGAKPISVQVWSDQIDAISCGAEADLWLSDLLQEPAQLAYMPEATHRPTDGLPETPLSFADGFPYLVATTASLRDLNLRIEGGDVPMEAFRPNIVLETETAWAEDDWAELRCGDLVFKVVSPCERCSVTTLDPAAPDRPRPDGEPLRTLAKFRRNARGKVIFAVNAVVQGEGILRVGDELRWSLQ